MKQTLGIVWVLAVAAVAVAGEKADWPMFQGDAAHTGAAAVPAVTRPRVLWQADIGIQGYLNNPVLAEGKVFVGSSGTAHNKPDEKDGVYCLDAKTGKVLWHQRTPKDACGVAWAGGRVFSTGDDGVLRAFASADGKGLWTLACQGELYCQPLIAGGFVLVGDASGCVIAVEQASGKKAWQAQVADPQAVEGNTVRGGLTAGPDRLYAAFLDGTTACLDLTGKVLWKRKVLGEMERLYPAPTLSGGRLFLGYARDTYFPTPAIKALDAQTGKDLWSGSGTSALDHFGNIRSSFALWNGLLLYGEPYSNTLMAVRASDGQAQWTVELGAPMFPHWPSPAVAGDVLYLPRHDGGLYAVDLKTRKRLWSLYLGDAAQIGPDLPRNIMPEDWKHCAWEPAVGQPLFASPALGADGTIYLGSGQGRLYAIGQDAAAPASGPAK